AEEQSRPRILDGQGREIQTPNAPPASGVGYHGVPVVRDSQGRVIPTPVQPPPPIAVYHGTPQPQAQARWVGSNYYELLNNQWVLRGQMSTNGGNQYFQGSSSTLPAGIHRYLIRNGHWYMQTARG